MIAAGHATTAVALFWALFLVASAHSVQTRIAAEVAPIDLGPERAADALTRLVYTRATVQEALRLYPPAYAIFRVARKSDEAGGIAIPKGAIVMVAPWLLHRHRRFCVTRTGSTQRASCPARRRPTASPICPSASARASALAPNSR